MKILLIGSGGRENALAWALSRSPLCGKLYCAPGNPGIEAYAECVNIAADDVLALSAFATQNAIDFVVSGPEAPLVKGLADVLRAQGIPVFGPSKAAAQLEGSKGFMKDLCARHNIATAAYGRFSEMGKASDFILKQKTPVVVKADGLAAGKGVIIAQTHQEALDAATDMLSGNAFGQAGCEIVVEEFLEGEELSYFAITDGKTILPFNSAQDHKRAYDGDEGPNTGGMGAYSPARLMTPELEQKILTRLIEPTVKGMEKDGYPFTGVLFAGIMVVDGEPVLLEYNVRFGDPECQTLMMRFQGDLAAVLLAAAQGRLDEMQDSVHWSDDIALCVVMAAKGYPGTHVKNTPIYGLDRLRLSDKAIVFHAGTARDTGGGIVNTGGRVLGITALGDTVGAARDAAYAVVDSIDWPEGFCRRDIGWRALDARESKKKLA